MKLFIATMIFSIFAQANTAREFANSLDRILSSTLNNKQTYQIGAVWGKKPVTQADLDSDIHFKRMALSTARMSSGGTGFYLGEFNGKHVMATNHHVCPYFYACSGPIFFPKLKIYTKAVEFYGSWPEIDLALFAVEVNATNAELLKSVASPFAFNKDLYHGQPLVTIGFGVAENPNSELMANRDDDCKVFSADEQYRLMGDPDELNPSSYKAWSFANGCDVSHGDSGSAMMDRNTGEVIGIIWTGRVPKKEEIQTKNYIDQLFNSNSEEIWGELSYGVPAVHMKSFLEKKLADHAIREEHVPTIEALLR